MAEGIKILIFRSTDLTTAVDIVARRWEPSLLDEHNRDGGGSFRIRIDDDALLDTPDLLDEGNIAQIKVDGVVRQTFEIKKKNIQIVPEGEFAGEWLEVSGPGLLDWYTHARVLPERGIQQNLEQRAFNFTAVQGTWYKAADWTTPVVCGPIHYENAEFPAKWPVGLHADWIWSQTGSAPVGDVYIRREFTTAAYDNYRLIASANDYAAIYVDGVRILTMTEVDSSQQTYAQDLELEAGNHVIAIKARNVGGTAGVVMALCKVIDQLQTEKIKDTHRVIWTGDNNSLWKINAYPATVPGFTLGQILNKLIAEASARGVRSMQNITPAFDDVLDSNGVPWGKTYDLIVDIGDDYRKVIQQIQDSYADIWVTPDFRLKAIPSRGIDRSVSVAGADPVIFRRGLNVLSADTSTTAEIANTAFVKTNNGLVESSGPADSISKYGRREAYLSAADSTSQTMTDALIKQLFDKFAQPRMTPTLSVTDDSGYTPWVDFGIGDWVLAPSDNDPLKLIKRRIMSISASENSDTGKTVYTCEIDSIQETYEERVARWIEALGNDNFSGGVTGTSSGGSPAGDLPAPGSGMSSPPIPYVSDQRTPTAPTGVTVLADVILSSRNTPVGKLSISWAHDSKATEGTDLTPESYEVWIRENNAAYDYYFLGATSSSIKTLYADGLRIKDAVGAPVQYQVVVRAVAPTGKLSEFSQPVAVTMVDDTTAPLKPSTPGVTVDRTVFTIKWDGKDFNGAAVVPDYEYTIVESAATSGATTWTNHGTMYGAGEMLVGGFGYTTRWFRLRCVDRSGNISVASVAASATAEPLVDADIILSAIDAAETQITNIDTASIKDGAILNAKLGDAAVTLAKIKDNEISLGKLNTAANDKITKGITDAATAQGAAEAADQSAGKAQAAADFALAEAKKNNLLINGDFDAEQVSGQPDSYTQYRFASATPHSGTHVGRLTSDAWRSIQWNKVPVTPGQVLEMRYWHRKDGTPDASAAWSVGFDRFNANGVDLGVDGYPDYLVNPSDTTSWQQTVTRYTVPSDTFFLVPRTTYSASIYTNTGAGQIDDVWLGDASAMAAAEAAQERADDAFADAGTALTAAGNAQTSANGKNNVYYVASLPSGTGFVDGDTAFIRSVEGMPYTAQYRWDEASLQWKPQQIGHQVMASVDLGKATVGELDGIYIKAKSLEADKLLISQGANLFTDPTIQDADGWASSYFSATGGKNGGGSLFIPQNSSQSGAYYALNTQYTQRRTRLVPGGTYRISGWVLTSADAPAGTVQLYLRYNNPASSTGSLASNVSGQFPYNYNVVPANTWTFISGMVVVPENTAYTSGTLGVFKQIGYTTGTTRWSDLSIQQAMAGELVVDGTITGAKVDAQSVAGAVGQFIQLDVSQLNATNATMSQGVIDKLYSDVVNSRKIVTNQLLVGSGPNMIPNGALELGDSSGWRTDIIYDTADKPAGYPASLRSPVASGTLTSVMSADWDVQPNTEYLTEYWMKADKPNSRIFIELRDQVGAHGTTNVQTPDSPYMVGGSYLANNAVVPTVWTKYSMITTTNATTNKLHFGSIYFNHSNGTELTATVRLAGFTMRPRANGNIVASGSIATRHLTVTEDMTVALLAAHKVKAVEIDTNDLQADTGFVGNMRTKILTTDVVNSTMVSAYAITSKHTITGATLQTTATSARGVKINSTGISAYSSTGVETFDVDASNGNVSIVGGTLTTPLIQTSALALRGIKLSSSGLAAYNSSNKQVFLLDGNEGDAAFDSRVMFGTSANPHWVIVPWESTTQERAGMWLVQGGASGLGGSETAGIYMDNANATFENRLTLRGMNGGGVEIIGSQLLASRVDVANVRSKDGVFDIQSNSSSYVSAMRFTGQVQMDVTPNVTGTANTIISASGVIQKTSSASRYKVDPQPMDLPDSLLDVPVKNWIDRTTLERQQEIDASPRPFSEQTMLEYNSLDLTRIPGVIAEEVEAASGRDFVTYGSDGLIESVSYDRYALARTQILKRKLDEALKRIDALEALAAPAPTTTAGV